MPANIREWIVSFFTRSSSEANFFSAILPAQSGESSSPNSDGESFHSGHHWSAFATRVRRL